MNLDGLSTSSEKTLRGNIIVHKPSRPSMNLGPLLVVLMMVLVPAAGCIHTNDGGSPDIIEEEGDLESSSLGQMEWIWGSRPCKWSLSSVTLGRTVLSPASE